MKLILNEYDIDPSCVYCYGLGQRYVRNKMHPCPCTFWGWEDNEEMRKDYVKSVHDHWWKEWRKIKPLL